MKTITSFPFTLIATQELGPPPPVPTINDKITIWPTGSLRGYGYEINDLAQLISSVLGSGSILPERRYVTGSDMPAGATYSVNGVNGAGQINDAYLSGKIFDLHRNGFLIDKGVDWDNDVVGGGFRSLIPGDVFGPDERFVAGFQPQFSPYIPTPDAIARFTNGEATITSNSTISAAMFRKIIRLQSSTNTLSVTLPAASSYPANVALYIVSDGGNHKQATLICAGSDNIKWNGADWPAFWIGQAAQMTLIPTSGGWIIESWSESAHFNSLGCVNSGYLPGPNQWLAVANPLADVPQLRSVYPRVWNWIQRLQATQAAAVISGAAWITKRQMWGTGDGSTTFNFPDISGTFARMADPFGQYDFDRYGNGTSTNVANLPGNFWTFAIPKHKHGYTGPGFTDGTANFVGGGTFNAGKSLQTDEQGTSNEAKPVSVLYLPLINI